jgi:hypothetical protein
MGQKTSWVTDVDGGGQETIQYIEGTESWNSTILSATPCMSGAISITGSFNFLMEEYDYTYSGTLHSDCRDKAE